MLLSAAKNLSEAFGFNDNIYHKISNLNNFDNLKKFNTSSIFFCTHSILEDFIPANINLFKEAILLVENNAHVLKKINELDFVFSKTILDMPFNRKIIYLSK